MEFKKIIKTLLPEYQIIESIRENGIINKDLNIKNKGLKKDIENINKKIQAIAEKRDELLLKEKDYTEVI